jgi:hypothetical protein
MVGVESTAPTNTQDPNSLIKPEPDTKPSPPTTYPPIHLPDDSIIAVKSFIDCAYSGSVTMTEQKAIFHLTIYNFAEKVSEVYLNDFMDSFRQWYFDKSTYMNQSDLCRIYEVGLRNSPLAKFGLKTVVYMSLKWPREWMGEGKSANRKGGGNLMGAGDERGGREGKQSLDEWTRQPMLLLDYAEECVKWQKKAGADPASLRGGVFHDHSRGSWCRHAMEV